MSRETTCAACGKRVPADDYCSRCGTSLDEETQQQVMDEHSASSEQRALQDAAEVLEQYTAQAEERDALARIRKRIEGMDNGDFPPLNDERDSL